ncbi:MAG: DUF2256 and DUF3253 domain-containing protein [Pseudomonadota bacterium]
MSGKRNVTDSKTCASCGREMTWRKKWARDWDQVRYCSDACRRTRVSATDKALSTAILEMLAKRPGKSICPSEAARTVGGGNWRALNEPARRAARRLVADGKIRMTQRGRTVDPSRAKGPVRLILND